MSKVEQIERDVRQLSEQELSTFRAWFGEYDAARWDEQLEADAQSGPPTRNRVRAPSDPSPSAELGVRPATTKQPYRSQSLLSGGEMRLRAQSTAMVFVAVTACSSSENQVSDSSRLPASVECADAQHLGQSAADDRGRSDQLTSDQERIYVGNRANFHAALAIVAELKCSVTLANTDSVLAPAFEAARKAHESRSMYERAFEWGKADFIATQAIALMIQAKSDTASAR